MPCAVCREVSLYSWSYLHTRLSLVCCCFAEHVEDFFFLDLLRIFLSRLSDTTLSPVLYRAAFLPFSFSPSSHLPKHLCRLQCTEAHRLKYIQTTIAIFDFIESYIVQALSKGRSGISFEITDNCHFNDTRFHWRPKGNEWPIDLFVTRTTINSLLFFTVSNSFLARLWHSGP